jgi:hypothetical protein
MRKPNHYNQILQLLQKLHIAYPQYNMGRHLATALDEYGDVWAVTDKELAFALTKYMNQLDMDVQREEDVEIARIIKQAMDLDNILKDEEEE